MLFFLFSSLMKNAEYGRDRIVSMRGDVYSYGIVLMETLTGKKLTDNMFDGDKM